MREGPPRLEIQYRIARQMPADVRKELEERTGARVGDTVIVRSDGSVKVVRKASHEDARALTPRLLRLRPTRVVHPPAP